MFRNYQYKVAEIRETVSLGLPLLVEKWSVAIWVCAIILGSYANFEFIHWTGGGGPEPQGCYFTDESILFIECPGSVAGILMAMVLNWAWLWTWGLSLLVGLLPFSLLLFGPAILTAFFAVRSMVRWVGRYARPN